MKLKDRHGGFDPHILSQLDNKKIEGFNKFSNGTSIRNICGYIRQIEEFLEYSKDKDYLKNNPEFDLVPNLRLYPIILLL